MITITPSPDTNSVLTWEMSIQNPPGMNYITNTDIGFLRLTFTGNAVTESTHSGQFAAWSIPPIGSTGTVQVVAQEIILDLDFGRECDARISMGGGVGAPPPAITSITLSGTNVEIDSMGPPNTNHCVLSTMNLSLPLNQWTPIATNAFDSSGYSSFTDIISPGEKFYRLQLPP